MRGHLALFHSLVSHDRDRGVPPVGPWLEIAPERGALMGCEGLSRDKPVSKEGRSNGGHGLAGKRVAAQLPIAYTCTLWALESGHSDQRLLRYSYHRRGSTLGRWINALVGGVENSPFRRKAGFLLAGWHRPISCTHRLVLRNRGTQILVVVVELTGRKSCIDT